MTVTGIVLALYIFMADSLRQIPQMKSGAEYVLRQRSTGRYSVPRWR